MKKIGNLLKNLDINLFNATNDTINDWILSHNCEWFYVNNDLHLIKFCSNAMTIYEVVEELT